VKGGISSQVRLSDFLNFLAIKRKSPRNESFKMVGMFVFLFLFMGVAYTVSWTTHTGEEIKLSELLGASKNKKVRAKFIRGGEVVSKPPKSTTVHLMPTLNVSVTLPRAANRDNERKGALGASSDPPIGLPSSVIELLLSTGHPVSSDVQGNLGPPSVVTVEVLSHSLC
jgi:hypothetical protein